MNRAARNILRTSSSVEMRNTRLFVQSTSLYKSLQQYVLPMWHMLFSNYHILLNLKLRDDNTEGPRKLDNVIEWIRYAECIRYFLQYTVGQNRKNDLYSYTIGIKERFTSRFRYFRNNSRLLTTSYSFSF